MCAKAEPLEETSAHKPLGSASLFMYMYLCYVCIYVCLHVYEHLCVYMCMHVYRNLRLKSGVALIAFYLIH